MCYIKPRRPVYVLPAFFLTEAETDVRWFTGYTAKHIIRQTATRIPVRDRPEAQTVKAGQ